MVCDWYPPLTCPGHTDAQNQKRAHQHLANKGFYRHLLNHQTATSSQAAARVSGVHVAVKICFKVVSSFHTIISTPPTIIRTGFFEIEAEYCVPRVPLGENKFQ